MGDALLGSLSGAIATRLDEEILSKSLGLGDMHVQHMYDGWMSSEV
jgi:hypothetical protein